MLAKYTELASPWQEKAYRSLSQLGSEEDSATLFKQTKIINTTKRFLKTTGHKQRVYRFDVVSREKQIDWIPGAFTLKCFGVL